MINIAFRVENDDVLYRALHDLDLSVVEFQVLIRKCLLAYTQDDSIRENIDNFYDALIHEEHSLGDKDNEFNFLGHSFTGLLTETNNLFTKAKSMSSMANDMVTAGSLLDSIPKSIVERLGFCYRELGDILESMLAILDYEESKSDDAGITYKVRFYRDCRKRYDLLQKEMKEFFGASFSVVVDYKEKGVVVYESEETV